MKQKGFTSLETTNTKQDRKRTMFLTGFTLIELLMVIAIVSLLSTIVMGNVNEVREKGRIAAGQQASANIKHGIGDQLVGEWEFNECSGTGANDTSGFDHAGTLNGDTSWATDSPYSTGCSLDFDGSGDTVSITDSDLLNTGVRNEITVEAWVKARNVYDWQTFVIRDNYYRLHTFNGRFRAFTRDSDGTYFYVSADEECKRNVWYHMAWVWSVSGGYTRFYIDGAEQEAYPVTRPQAVQPGGWVFGDYKGTLGFDGFIDNVHIYTKALTTAQIQQLYAEGLSTHPALASK